MTNVGMDVEAVRSFATQLNSDAGEIDNLITKLSGQLSTVHWVGNDASRFTSDWDSSYRPQLQAVSNALRDAANVANANATQQEQASS